MIYWYFFNSFEPKEFIEPSTSYFSLLYNITGKLNMQKGLSELLLKKLKLRHPFFVLASSIQTLESISALSYLGMEGIGELDQLQDVIQS